MIDSTEDQKFEQNTPTVQDEMNLPPPGFAAKNETGKTEETVIANNGAEDDYIISNSNNIKLNELKVKDIVNSQKEEITPDIIEEETPKLPEKKVSNLNFNNNNNKQSNNNYVVNKIPKKKASTKQRLIYEEKNEKNKNDEDTDELFKKAIENATRIFPPIEHDNDLSVKVTEVLYDKYVGKNLHKSIHPDIYARFKDESIRQERELTRTKDDAKRISNMIERQEKYEEIKHDKKIGRQRELKKKIKEVCVFIPNGKKNIQENMRTPTNFYLDQKKFMMKKEGNINRMAKDKKDGEEKIKNVPKVSKKSEIMANNKNPNETLEQFCKRLAEEKLKNKKETLDNKTSNKEIKKLTKKDILSLTEKLHKEGETFKINRKKKEKELVNKLKDNRNKKNFVLEKSTKVIFDKFVSVYDKVVNDLFNNDNENNIEEKRKNYDIDKNQYKMLLINLGFLKSDITDNEKNDSLIENSFNNYLAPIEGKINTDKFLIFCLAALGIYKGKDEKVLEHFSKITQKIKTEEENQEKEIEVKPVLTEENKSNNILMNNQKKKQIKTSTEFINYYLPNLDLDKYSFTEKECNVIKKEFFVFVLGISETWSKDLVKKKQERLDKLEETNKKNNLENLKKLENKNKREEEIISSFRRKIFNEELQPLPTDPEQKYNTKTLKKSFKVKDMYEILEKRKQRELDALKAKKEEDINKQCTFHPNTKNKKPLNKKEVQKDIEKLYLDGKNSYIKKRQGEQELSKNEFNLEKDCTFKPAIKDYKGDYFGNNPLKEDILVNTEIKKMEKLREEQGYINKEIKKQMNFGIEPKTNKDNINKRVAQKRGEKVVNNIKNEFKDFGNFDGKGNRVVLKLEVNLENNKTELLIIQPEDDYIKVVDNFCAKFELNDDKKIRLIRAIKDKMRKN